MASMNIKISAFYQHMPPHTGGAALRGHSIATKLALLLESNEDCLQFYCTTPEPTAIKGATIETLDVHQVENTMNLKRRLLGELQLGYVAAKRIFNKSKMPTLVVVSSPGYIAAVLQIFFARLHGVPYVLEVRDIYPQVYAEAKLLHRNSILYRILLYISRGIYLRAELVICATQGLAREVAREAPIARIAHIYNGFPASLAERSSKKHSRFTVCFHGVLGFFQDVETLLRITERLAQFDIDVTVIGYGRKEAALQDSSLPNLRFLGRQTFENTIAEVERCHLGLCLRLDDGVSKDAFPVKVWEYIGLGIPCILTPPSEAGDFLQKHCCGIVLESGDVDGIVSAVLGARGDGSQLDTMAANCRKLASSYTREQTGLAAAQEIYKIALQSCQ